MMRRLALLLFVALLVVPGWVAADIEIIRESRSDSMLDMGRSRSGDFDTSVMHLAEGRLRVDEGTSSIIVHADDQKLYLLDHTAKTAAQADLPIDVSQILPPGVSAQMLDMMHFDIVVTPTDESKRIGQWTARRYDVRMTSTMARIESKVWAVEDVADFDTAAFSTLYREIAALQPGMTEAADAMAEIKGFQVASETVVIMSAMVGKPITSSERVVSVKRVADDGSRYEVPEGYESMPLDLTALN